MNKMILAISALLVTTVVHAQTVNCMAFNGDAEDESDTLTVTLQGNKISVTDSQNGSFKGQLDSTYQPRQNKNYVRYTGEYQATGVDGETWLLVEKSLLKGQSGQIKVQNRWDDFSTQTYRCE